jgi:glycosyltransferase involved in cell wall biosynthesis
MLVAVLFANYGPYHLARISSFYKSCHQVGWQVVGIELARTETQYPWKVEVNNLPFSIIAAVKEQELEQTQPIKLIQQLSSVLNQVKPDILAIAGYSHPAMISALLWCILHRKPAILLSESKEDDAPRVGWKETFKKSIIKRYKAALVGGQPHKRYLIQLGMAPDAIFPGYDVVGNEVFHPGKIRLLPKPIDRPYFLTSNRFISRKNLSFLLYSYAEYRQIAGSNSCDLVLCGDGELRSQLEHYITELDLQNFVHLPGFLQQEQLLPYLAHATCFIHASLQEQWGLVVNEAMAAGLPVLVSNRCGCFEDLVIEGVNGFGFDPENSQQITDLMLKITSGEIDLVKIGHTAFEHIQKFSPDYFAQGLMQAVEYTLTHR